MNYQHRKILRIIAASSSVLCLSAACQSSSDIKPFQWEGYALGSKSSIQLYGNDADEFEKVIEEATTLVAKLDKIFSHYDQNSEINALNNSGKLDAPSPEMLDPFDQISVADIVELSSGGLATSGEGMDWCLTQILKLINCLIPILEKAINYKLQ